MIPTPYRLSLAALAMAAFASWSAPAQACKCRPLTVAEGPQDAVAIFEGRVTKIADEPKVEGGPPPGKLVTFSLVRIWKALENEETITVRTSESSASCGFGFELSTSYLVYAGGALDALTVSSCSRTRPMSDANEDLASLGVGITPVKIEPATDAGAKEPVKTKTGGCASGKGQASASLWLLGLPALGLMLRRRS